jgi:type IV pilus assembly protein PilV
MKQGHFIKGSRGFSLIEALIGFFILSIGMLGVASLQGVSLKASQASVYGSVAMMKVEELFESMRANPTALATYQSAGVFGDCTGSNVCSATQLAADDVYWWEKNLKAGLPDAATTLVTVTPAVAPSGLATVQIDVNWAERGKTSTSSISRSYTTTANICTAVPC